MFVIVASEHDQEAAQLAGSRSDVGLLTCRDLTSAGWAFRPDRPDESIAVVGGIRTPAAAIDGILTRRPCVFPEECLDIVVEDRRYVAAELTAFLLAWLWLLPCPVLNPPSTNSLAGPSWRIEQWLHAAARLGIPINPPTLVGEDHRGSRQEPPTPVVTVVGTRSLGDVAPELGAEAVRLAAGTGTPLLAVTFSSSDRHGRIVDASAWPALTEPDVQDAVWAFLARRPPAAIGRRE
jgi:hypothetical protein